LFVHKNKNKNKNKNINRNIRYQTIIINSTTSKVKWRKNYIKNEYMLEIISHYSTEKRPKKL